MKSYNFLFVFGLTWCYSPISRCSLLALITSTQLNFKCSLFSKPFLYNLFSRIRLHRHLWEDTHCNALLRPARFQPCSSLPLSAICSLRIASANVVSVAPRKSWPFSVNSRKRKFQSFVYTHAAQLLSPYIELRIGNWDPVLTASRRPTKSRLTCLVL